MASSMIRRSHNELSSSAFTLVEMLVVTGIIVILLGLAVPAINSLKYSRDIGAGAYDIAGALETARSYALANNTYTWVGFFEENANQSQVAGIGNVVISVVAADDGVQGFDPNAATSGSNTLAGARLLQVGKLLRVNNIHLAAFDDGTGDGMTFNQRPRVGVQPYPDEHARIGDNDPPSDASKANFSFSYPTNATSPQYTFTKTIEFNPQGESKIDSTLSTKPIVEIGLRPTHGNVVDTRSPDTVAIQLSGIGGTVKIYRK